ncbi:MAG: ATP-binding protein [Bacillaceae bacterium]|nr:ATP-binding protein [Bacillaceae bacterium]
MNNSFQVDQFSGKFSRPSFPKGSYPIETGRYLIATNEIDRLYKKVVQCLTNRSPGAIIFGRPRLGKTRALEYLMHILPEEFERIPIYFLCCREYNKPSENIFFQDILIDIRHGVPYSGKADRKRQRLLWFLIEQVNKSGQNKIVFFFDDAQRLHEIQYGWLMDIYNELDRAGISLTVFLVGQEELLSQRSVFVEEGKHQIIGRFMVQQQQFNGIKTKSDLKEVLIGYDQYSYPPESGWTMTKYYFPDAFEEGFRLENYSDLLFDVFVQLRKEASISGKIEIPMQYLTLTIEYILRQFGIEGEVLEYLKREHFEEGVENSGYINAELYRF